MNQPGNNWFCDRCGHPNQANWNACQQCRIPNPYMPSILPQAMKASPKGMVIIFLVFAGFCGMCGLLGLVTDRGSKNTPGILVSSSPLSASESLTFQEKVKTFSASENLERAKTLLKNNPSKEQVYQATIHL